MSRLRLLDEVTWEGRPVPGDRTRTLLRTLAEAGPRGLSENGLVEEIWGDDPPANPAKALQVVVSRARSATCPEAVARTARGYRLDLPVDDVDVWALRPAGLRLAAEGRHAEALPLLLRAAPDDDVTAALLRSLAAVRGVPAALEHYEAHRSGLANRLGVDPAPALQALHRELLARDRPVRSGLRYDATELVGRDRDVIAVSALLRSARVVTLLGPGGLGKTRLAQVLARAAEQPVVHVVELVAVTSPDDLIGEVGSALGVRDSVSGRRVLTAEQRADVRSRVVQQVEQVPTLLVLDNCEHIVDAVADLAAFLVAMAPDLTVLATSRAPLAISAEHVYPLAQLDTRDSAALFARRAAAARPGVRLDDAAVTEIASRLDGLPLAIELAAAKVRVMSVEDIARRLSHRFDLLRGGDRSAPDRHQTLLAVIDWSWNLLREPERRALRHLSVFHDGFTLAAAEAMLGPVALEAVQELVDQSLLTVTEEAYGVRYRMLETVREFGRMQLVDAGEDDEAARAQRAWAVAYCRTYGHWLHTRHQPEGMDAVRAEENNLVDVLRQALAVPEPAQVVEIFAPLGSFWTIAGDHARVFTLSSSVLEALSDWSPPDELLEQARLSLCLLLFGAVMATHRNAAECRKLVARIGTDSASPGLRAVLSIMMMLDDSRQQGGRAALDTLLDDAEPEARAVAQMFLGHERENSGDPQGAVRAVSEAIALVDGEHGPWLAALLHAQLCGLYSQLGDITGAAEHAAAAMPVLERLGAVDDVLQTKAVLAMAALDRGAYDQAARIADELDAMQHQGTFGAPGAVIGTRAEVLLATGREREGLSRYREAATAMREVRFPDMDADPALMPWVIAVEATTLAAYARHGDGEDGADLYDTLAAKAAPLLDSARPLLDLPVCGVALFGLGLWGLLRGALAPQDAIRLLVLADRFAYHRSTPTLRWEHALADAERIAPGVREGLEAEYGTRRGPDLLAEARAAVDHIFRL